MTEPIQPIVPEGTPLPPAPVGVPPFPITPFSVWTWSSPVIPEFYWNIYSAEQRIKSICKEIGKIEAYLQYLVTKTNENIIELHQRIDQLTERVADLERHVEEEVARLDALIAQLRDDLTQEIADREAADEALGDRIDEEINDRQAADGVLHTEIAQEVRDRTHADDQLHQEISTETQARIHADNELGERIDAEAQSRQAADAGLHAEVAAEATARAHADETLHTEISTETSDRIHADDALESKLEAEIQAEADERQAGDTDLRESISTEETARKAADAGLGQRITQEVSDREAADGVLETKISTEAHEREAAFSQLADDLESEVAAREAGDAALRSDLTAEEEAREAGDTALEAKISKRLLPTEVQAGDEIAITRPDPSSNTIVISSTVAHSISALESLITSLQAALAAETNERRADDGELWTAVNQRIERGKILAGPGIRVDNDPDQSTVTISSTSTIEGGDGIKVETEGGKSTISLSNPYPSVEGRAPVEVTGTPEGYTISVSEATEGNAGVISMAQVKGIAGIFAGDGINVSGRSISLKTSGRSSIVRQSSRKSLIAPIISEDGDGVNKDIEFGPIKRVERRPEFAASGLEFSTSVEGSDSSGWGVGLGVAAGQGLEIGEEGRLRAKTATETEAGIISEARVKELIAAALAAQARDSTR